MLSPYQYEKLNEQYGDLIHMIAHRISGDSAVTSHEDCVQDLWIAALNAVKGYERQNNGANGTFDEFWTEEGKPTSGFHKYIKTCLWNAKNTAGQKVVKRQKVQANVDVVEYQHSLEDTTATPSVSMALLLDDMENILNADQMRIIHTIAANPGMIHSSTGKVEIGKLAKKLGISRQTASRNLIKIGSLIKNEL